MREREKQGSEKIFPYLKEWGHMKRRIVDLGPWSNLSDNQQGNPCDRQLLLIWKKNTKL